MSTKQRAWFATVGITLIPISFAGLAWMAVASAILLLVGWGATLAAKADYHVLAGVLGIADLGIFGVYLAVAYARSEKW